MAYAAFKGVLKRLIRVYGVSSPVVLTLTDKGIEASIPGRRTKLFASWEHVVRNMQTPATVPSYLAGKPLEFLRKQSPSKEDKVHRYSSD